MDEIQNPVQSLRNPEASDHEKKEAAANLAKLASTNDQHREAIAAAGGILPLVALLESGSDGAKRRATVALANLAKNDQNQAAIRAAGGILPLVALVESGSDGAKKQAAIALTFLAENAQNQQVIASAGGIPALVALVASGSDGAKRNAAWALANLSDNAQNREAIAASGGIPPLVPLVASPNFFAQQDAARTLGNLATVSENRGVIAAAGGIPPLVELITKGGSDEKRHAVHAVRNLAADDQHKAAIAAAGAIPPLVALVRCRSPDLQGCAACVLANLAKNDQNKRAIVAADGVQALQEMAENGKLLGVDRILAQEVLKYFQSDSEGGTKLGHDPARRPSTAVCAAELLGEMSTLESGSDEQKAKAAEQLGTWAAISDENRVAISREGGAEAMVALLVTGNDDMKCRAARALRNLANNCEAKTVILKAGGIATLELIARHGKGKVKEAADEALKLLSQKQETKSSPAKNAKFGLTPAAEPTSDSPIDAKSIQATTHSKIAEGAGDTIPTGEGTRVAMFSARFDGGPIEQTFRRVFQILFDRKYDILMVAADAGESFGDLTTKYLGRLYKEHGTMIAVCTKHYGEMTASAYSSHKELKFALDYEKFVTVLPLRVDDTYPPEPPGGPDHEYDKEYLAQGYILSVFKPSVVFLECREKSEREIAAKIASILQRHKVAKDGSH